MSKTVEEIRNEIDTSLALRKQLIDTMLFVKGPHYLRGYLEHAYTSGAYITREIADTVARNTLDELLVELLAMETVTAVKE